MRRFMRAITLRVDKTPYKRPMFVECLPRENVKKILPLTVFNTTPMGKTVSEK